MARFYLVTLATETRVIWPMAGEDVRELAIDALRGLAPPGTTWPVEISGPFDTRLGQANSVTVDLTLPE